MQSQRQRVYSYSSNETILETYSSSPPSSTGLVDQSLIPTWQLSARDLIAPLCQDGSSSRTVGPQKQVHDNGRLAVAIEGQQEMPKVVGEHHGDESEESIDWDARSEEAQEQWRHPRVDRRATAIATYPQTVGFWFDWWIGQIGFAAFDLDLQALCANMQRWRDKNDIARVPTHLEQQPEQHESLCSPPALAYTTNAIRNLDGSYATESDWDRILEEMKLAARDMHQMRKWRVKGRESIVGWCKLRAEQRIEKRGDFVEESEVGYEVERELDGKRWAIKLGYRRRDAVVNDMDLDEDNEGGTRAGDNAGENNMEVDVPIADTAG